MGRKYKYNEKKNEHWVEKETLGTLTKKTTHGTRSELHAEEDETPEEADVAELSEHEGMISERDDVEEPQQGKNPQEDIQIFGWVGGVHQLSMSTASCLRDHRGFWSSPGVRFWRNSQSCTTMLTS